MPDVPIHYSSPDEDGSRWIGFPFRDGDIVISSRSKTGTTWLQMICALLVFQTPELPDFLTNISPWLDWLGAPRSDVYARLARQDHRRFIKTHTPLDGLPVVDRVTYLVIGRHPLDMAVSLYHQGGNLNRERMSELTGQPDSGTIGDRRPPLRDWLIIWIEQDVEPSDSLDSLPGVLWHLTDAWDRRPVQDVVWASTGLTDIQHQGHGPGKDVHNGDHGTEEAPSSSVVHPGVQGRDRRVLSAR